MHRSLVAIIALAAASCSSSSGPGSPGGGGATSARDTGPSNQVAAPLDAAAAPPVVDSAGEPTPHCQIAGYTAPVGARPELIADVTGAVLSLGLRNVGTEPVCMYTHIATHELQHDWLQVLVVDDPKQPRTLRFWDSRDKSAAFSALIGPGQIDRKDFDLAAWALRDPNGRVALSSGRHQMLAIYDTRKETDVWAGKLEVRFAIDVP